VSAAAMGVVLVAMGGDAHAERLPSIFNGKDLAGWKVPAENPWWSVVEGRLEVKSDPQQRGSILWTDRSYASFILECEFRMGDGIVDSGFFLRNETDQIQIGISGSLKRDLTASPYIAGKGYPVEAQGVAKLLKPKAWNAMTIVAKGGEYTVWLNHHRVMTYASQTASKRGPIGIQLHAGKPMAIAFRNLRLAELD
jgi:hypothetical protein